MKVQKQSEKFEKCSKITVESGTKLLQYDTFLKYSHKSNKKESQATEICLHAL